MYNMLLEAEAEPCEHCSKCSLMKTNKCPKTQDDNEEEQEQRYLSPGEVIDLYRTVGDVTPFVNPILTLQDRPGESSLIVFTTQCNWYCTGCHNMMLLREKKFGPISRNELSHYLDSPIVQTFVISGGEPTLLGKRLVGELIWVRNIFPDIKISLDTNGTNREMLELLTRYKLVDNVAIDMKEDIFASSANEDYKVINGGHDGAADQVKDCLEFLHQYLPNSIVRTVKYPSFSENKLLKMRNDMAQHFPKLKYFQNTYIEPNYSALHNLAVN